MYPFFTAVDALGLEEVVMPVHEWRWALTSPQLWHVGSVREEAQR